ncbi:MAG: DUF108 domain-containing protein [Candidatus Omnitrophica bacterium]|nr:DUF108 domain-containing protein [Candidatus Omnitrophota bacterium]
MGIVGCGAIGTALAQAIEHDYAKTARLVALSDAMRPHAHRLQRLLRSRPPIVSLPALIRRSDLVIEAASGAAASRVARLALAKHRDVLVMSSGGLLADPSWQRAVRRSQGRLYVPSGALCGVDGVKALAVGTMTRVRLTTREPPRALAAAPYVRMKRLRLSGLRRPRVLFTGSPRQAVAGFPQNANVAATLVLACLGRRGVKAAPRLRPTIRIIADPAIRTNRHELEVEGDCGRMICRAESRPSRTNPKTSELAIRSALATLDQIFQPVRIGT